ncbi:MAG: chorismate synthase [Lachnospiraceae bacterium]|nr:chorismate synthase [Lachnospiraceae bacterium]
MAGSTLGDIFKISTWGESHGRGLGVVVDGCPAGLPLSEEDIQRYLDKRKPGQTRYSTPRKEGDKVEILSGIFEGKTTGTPISMAVLNTSQRSSDYGDIATYYRPGHADYTFDMKYGFRDYRGGGRSSGRETIGRVAAGAIAVKILAELGIRITAYTKSIGPITIDPSRTKLSDIEKSPLRMPDLTASEQAECYLEEKMKEHDSSGGIIECIVSGMKPGIGEPVFGKLDAALAGNIFSIGAVKGVEIGEGFGVAVKTGSENNDDFYMTPEGRIAKKTNFAGGILGGISDGSDIILRAAIKPTPSIFKEQQTVNKEGENIEVKIKGRHDPIIVPRAVVVVEAMTALTLVDKIFVGMSAKMDRIREFFI